MTEATSSPQRTVSRYLTHIIYLRQPNQGVSVARNYGMMMAKGRFIQFVDGDDYSHAMQLTSIALTS